MNKDLHTIEEVQFPYGAKDMTEFNKRYLDFCKPFILAVKEVYETMMGTEITPGKPGLKESKKSYGDYSSIMGINGTYQGAGPKKKFRGSLVLSWPEEVYIKGASAMLMEEYTEFNDEIADVGMEICNITMGNAKKVLSEEGYLIEMSIPTSVSGKNHEIKAQDGIVTIATPMECGFGTFYIELSYEDYDC
jgi:chemotaxis protein CheX